jgi:hypothetical protein
MRKFVAPYVVAATGSRRIVFSRAGGTLEAQAADVALE